MTHPIDSEELIIRFLQGAATSAEAARLRAWRAEAEANERRFQEARELWALTGLGAAVAGEVPSSDEVLERARREAAEASPAGGSSVEAESRSPGRWKRSAWRRRVGRGALAAGLVAAAWLGLSRLGGPEATLVQEVVAENRTTVSLPDGSSVRLAPESRMDVYESPDEILVELQGRAFFAAENTRARSLIVRTAVGQVTTLGTRFEVRSGERALRVLVVDGRVAVSVADEAVEVGEGEMTRAAPGTRLSTTAVEDVYGELEWMGNHLAFKGTPLERAVEEIEERFGVPITITAPALREFPVTATFTDQPVAVVVRVLCELARATCESGPDGIRIGS